MSRPLCTVVNLKTGADYDVYCGRPGKGWSGYFGNPFPIQRGQSRGDTIQRFTPHFLERVAKDGEYRRRVLGLRGQRLGCFCTSWDGVSDPGPIRCHAIVIARWVNEQCAGMRITERPWRSRTLREWRCCGHLWQLILTPRCPGRERWPGPTCPTCQDSAAMVLAGFA